jgi:hypothetical protein
MLLHISKHTTKFKPKKRKHLQESICRHVLESVHSPLGPQPRPYGVLRIGESHCEKGALMACRQVGNDGDGASVVWDETQRVSGSRSSQAQSWGCVACTRMAAASGPR